ncbi:nuclear transport factor 2 family protein [Pseudomonas sp. B392_1p]|uniref:nuclear transport factor 2 family protein n=1 Tax=Pseudomonas sp. B392_1p TaxID=3457507 RepID=UPI003FD26508
MSQDTLLARLERVEAQLAIGQLPARYALAVDGRDLDALAELFAEDVDCGRWGKGREALKNFYASESILQAFYRSVHQICGQTLEFQDAEHATGTVYCRAEHEDGEHWVVMAICYFDQYQRHDGRWYFVRRDERHWYSTDWQQRPGNPTWQSWPGKYTEARYQPRLPAGFPSWEGFWARSSAEQRQRITRQP